MDSVDQKIIKMLRANGRESFANIGKAVNLSAPAIAKRVKQLEKNKVILGYSLELNHEKLGHNTKVYIILRIHQSRTLKMAYNRIKEFEEVQRCDRITGEDRLCILAFFKDNKALVDMLERISQYGVPDTRVILEV